MFLKYSIPKPSIEICASALMSVEPEFLKLKSTPKPHSMKKSTEKLVSTPIQASKSFELRDFQADRPTALGWRFTSTTWETSGTLSAFTADRSDLMHRRGEMGNLDIKPVLSLKSKVVFIPDNSRSAPQIAFTISNPFATSNQYTMQVNFVTAPEGETKAR